MLPLQVTGGAGILRRPSQRAMMNATECRFLGAGAGEHRLEVVSESGLVPSLCASSSATAWSSRLSLHELARCTDIRDSVDRSPKCSFSERVRRYADDMPKRLPHEVVGAIHCGQGDVADIRMGTEA